MQAPVIPQLPRKSTPEQIATHVNKILPQIGSALRHIVASGSAVSAVPVLVSAMTSYDGSEVLLMFSEPMATPPSAPAGFVVKLNGATDVVTAVALGSSATTIALALTTHSASGTDTITVAYTPGTIQSASGDALAGFSVQAGLSAFAPVVEDAVAEFAPDGVIFVLQNGYTQQPSLSMPSLIVDPADVANAVSNGSAIFVCSWTRETVGGVANCYSKLNVYPAYPPPLTEPAYIGVTMVCRGMVAR